uniref:Uncharacterized protein n=1 Tax=Salmo trutta TaxID=8032 RepID=A0A673WPK4_SALTR
MRATLLCLLCMAMCLAGIPASPVLKAQKNNQAAPIDDMNVLMYGVLQFSETLHHVYESTDAKFARIERSLRRQEERLERLGQDDQGDQPRDIPSELPPQQHTGIKGKVHFSITHRLCQTIQCQHTQSCSVPFINSYVRVCFQDRALKHSSVLEGLLTWTQFQKQSIESQGQQLTKLQKLVGIIAEHSLKNAK